MIMGKWLYVSGREQGPCAGMSTVGYTCMGLWDITGDRERLAAWEGVYSNG